MRTSSASNLIRALCGDCVLAFLAVVVVPWRVAVCAAVGDASCKIGLGSSAEEEPWLLGLADRPAAVMVLQLQERLALPGRDVLIGRRLGRL